MDVGADVETGLATEQTELKAKHKTFGDALGASIIHSRQQLQSVGYPIKELQRMSLTQQ